MLRAPSIRSAVPTARARVGLFVYLHARKATDTVPWELGPVG
jgi:hypothetical protein